MNTVAGTITCEEKFYGYIIGLSLERSEDNILAKVPTRMFAMFEYGSV